MEDPRIKELMEKARSGSLSMTEKNELTGLLKPTTPALSGPDALGAKVPSKVTEEQFNDLVKEEMNRTPATIVTAASNQMGSIPKVVALPSKKIDQYQRDVEGARLNAATVPGESNEGKLPPFPIMNSASETKAEPIYDKNGWYQDANGKWVAGPNAQYGGEAKPEPKVEAPAPEAPKTETPILDADKPVKDKRKFGEVIKELASKYGVPLLEMLEAVGKYRGGITTPTVIEKKYTAKLQKEEADYVNKLAEYKSKSDEERQQKLLERQQAFEAEQNELNRIADKEARGIELSSKEKLLKMELAASGAAKKSAAPASIIPE